MPTTTEMLADELLAVDDVELVRRAYAFTEKLDDDSIADDHYMLTSEILERFAPRANLAYVREECGGDADEFASTCDLLARSAFRRTYGIRFDTVVAQSIIGAEA